MACQMCVDGIAILRTQSAPRQGACFEKALACSSSASRHCLVAVVPSVGKGEIQPCCTPAVVREDILEKNLSQCVFFCIWGGMEELKGQRISPELTSPSSWPLGTAYQDRCI